MKHILWIGLSVVVALILTILPLPLWAAWGKPEWLLLVVIYWTLALPHRFSVGIAWSLGLLLDALSGSLLGVHALAMAIVAYITVKWHLRIRVTHVWQQAITVLFLVLIYQGILYLIQGLTGQAPETAMYWLPTVTSMLLWPWVFIILRDWRRRFKLT